MRRAAAIASFLTHELSRLTPTTPLLPTSLKSRLSRSFVRVFPRTNSPCQGTAEATAVGTCFDYLVRYAPQASASSRPAADRLYTSAPATQVLTSWPMKNLARPALQYVDCSSSATLHTRSP
ncbi:uncharacterized protein [Dermacentor andersoni]|uniref:uncharacterized protein n=1 Tax=Dermacentor andersoni TaxID=34620 RepID=UPI002416DB0A|nr:uncharacterized protein LOC126532422 [Dermacentor andersoni]